MFGIALFAIFWTLYPQWLQNDCNFQKTEVAHSNAMEKEGFIRCRRELDRLGVNVTAVTTDRHLGIAKYMREEWSEVSHFFDTWHIAKGTYNR